MASWTVRGEKPVSGRTEKTKEKMADGGGEDADHGAEPGGPGEFRFVAVGRDRGDVALDRRGDGLGAPAARGGRRWPGGGRRRLSRSRPACRRPFCLRSTTRLHQTVAIADAARRLVEQRGNWPNPPDCVDWAELHPDFPKQPVPRNDHTAVELKRRTLTRLYNVRPQCLVDAHRQLDAAVADAYGRDVEMSEDETLRKLLELNRECCG